jgi:outer membrane protein OmpA-like peptidoglycan-associated protein
MGPMLPTGMSSTLQVTLTGMTATAGTPAGRRKLSLDRAAAVRDILGRPSTNAVQLSVLGGRQGVSGSRSSGAPV